MVVLFDDNIVYQRLARRCADPDHALTGMRDLVSRPDLIRGQRTLEQLHEELQATHGLSMSLSEFEGTWLAPYTRPLPGMAEFLATLSVCCRLVLLSNVDKYYWQTIRKQHPETEYFRESETLLSCELGVALRAPGRCADLVRLRIGILGSDA